jgi:hypothetical protein
VASRERGRIDERVAKDVSVQASSQRELHDAHFCGIMRDLCLVARRLAKYVEMSDDVLASEKVPGA